MYAAPTIETDSDGEDHFLRDTLKGAVNPITLARLIAEIRETSRAREDMVRAEQRLILQAKAITRRLNAAAGDHVYVDTLTLDVPGAAPVAEGDHLRSDDQKPDVSLATISIMHLEEARVPLHTSRRQFEREMVRLAKRLPVWPWVESVRGFGALGLAQIVGECGDLWLYSNPAKVWKRMGLAVIEGERQRRIAGASALEHGYVPRRRAIMWNIGDSLIKGNRDGDYRTFYLTEKERQREKLPDAPQALIHSRAQRHMEKRLLKHLWQAWRASTPHPALRVE